MLFSLCFQCIFQQADHGNRQTCDLEGVIKQNVRFFCLKLTGKCIICREICKLHLNSRRFKNNSCMLEFYIVKAKDTVFLWKLGVLHKSKEPFCVEFKVVNVMCRILENSLILQNICIRQDEVNFSIMKCGRELFVLTDALLYFNLRIVQHQHCTGIPSNILLP